MTKLNDKEMWAPLSEEQKRTYLQANGSFPPSSMHTHPAFNEHLMHSHDADLICPHWHELVLTLGKRLEIYNDPC